jgi:hypothetical protein
MKLLPQWLKPTTMVGFGRKHRSLLHPVWEQKQ